MHASNISRMLQEALQLRDGRWLFIPVICESDAKDVEKLLLAKMRPPRNTYMRAMATPTELMQLE